MGWSPVPKPLHHIKPSSIRLQDLIRVHGKYHDTDTTKVGVVAKRSYIGGTTEYTTAQGVVLLEVHADGTMGGTTRVTLIRRMVNSKPFPDQVETVPTLWDDMQEDGA